MQVIGEHGLLDPLCKRSGIEIGKRADIVADTGADVSGTGGGITGIGGILVDSQGFNDGLQLLIDGIHILQTDALDLKTLTGGQMHKTVAISLGDLLDHAQDFCVQIAARYTNSGSADAAFFGHTERILL